VSRSRCTIIPSFPNRKHHTEAGEKRKKSHTLFLPHTAVPLKSTRQPKNIDNFYFTQPSRSFSSQLLTIHLPRHTGKVRQLKPRALRCRGRKHEDRSPWATGTGPPKNNNKRQSTPILSTNTISMSPIDWRQHDTHWYALWFQLSAAAAATVACTTRTPDAKLTAMQAARPYFRQRGYIQ